MKNKEPTLLALDTGSTDCQVGLASEGRRYYKKRKVRAHSQVVLTLIDEVLSEAGVNAQDLSAIAVNQGPGSFTGLRVGLSVAQGLAFAADCPVIPIASLEVIASYLAGLPNVTEAKYCFVAIDARMDQIYSAWFALNVSQHENNVEQISEISVVAPADIFVPAFIDGHQVIAMGSGLQYLADFPESIRQKLTVIGQDQSAEAAEVSIETLLSMALQRIESEVRIAAADLDALYVRNKVTGRPG